MTTRTQSTQPLTSLIQRYPLTCFFVAAIGVDWLLSLVAIWDNALFLPVALAMSYVPALAAWLVLRLTGTADERQAFGRRLRSWRVGWRWVLVALLIMPVIHLVALGIGAFWFGGAIPFHWQRFALILAILPVNLGEEIAWRGFALPRLQTRFNSLTAALILGALWAALHFVIWTIGIANPLPAILLASGFAIGVAVIMTWLFNHTAGSVPLATICHAAMDTMFIAVSPLAETNLFLTAWALVAGLTALVAVGLVLTTSVNLGDKRSV
jgi:membrane protease YdiL (CAAX protease family)